MTTLERRRSPAGATIPDRWGRKAALLVAVAAGLGATPDPTAAALHRFDFAIDASQVRNRTDPDGTTSSPAKGYAHIVVDDVAGSLTYTIS
jgi:hypothetical protein